jgi:alanine racemase
MDWTLVDVTDIPEVRVGDEVILIGQANGRRILAEDVAAWCGTISYEITSGISGRVPRVIIPAAPAQGDAGRREVSE